MTLADFYKANMGLVHDVSRRGFSRLAAAKVTIDYEDVFQEMSVVFIKAFEGFDESRGFKFSTYYFMCAYNRLNKWAQDMIEERLKHGVVSIDELNAGSEDGDANLSSILEEFADPSNDPESSYRVRELLEYMGKTLSPLAGLIMEWSVTPPEEILTEVRKAQSYADYGRSRGYNTRCMVRVTPRYVATFIRMISEISQLEVNRALKEIDDFRYQEASRFIGV